MARLESCPHLCSLEWSWSEHLGRVGRSGFWEEDQGDALPETGAVKATSLDSTWDLDVHLDDHLEPSPPQEFRKPLIPSDPP